MLICLKPALETHCNVWPAIIPSSIDGKLGQENICESRFMPSQDSFNSSYESYNFVENTHMSFSCGKESHKLFHAIWRNTEMLYNPKEKMKAVMQNPTTKRVNPADNLFIFHFDKSNMIYDLWYDGDEDVHCEGWCLFKAELE